MQGNPSLTLLALLFLQLPAQQKALKIGDAIPEKIWTTQLSMVNSPNRTTTLAKHRDKLILLDFWNTWCSACLKAFPKMENLQEKYDSRVKILAVSSQDRPTLEKFFASKNGQRFKGVVSVTDDQLFKKLFPHVGVPFIVWIKDGKLLTTTDGDQVNENTIEEILSDGQSSLQTVVQRNDDGPLMMSPDIELEKSFVLSNYTFFGKGRMRGLGFGTKFHRSADIIYGRQFTNISLSEMYRIITDEIFQQKGDIFSEKRMITELKGEDAFENPKRKDGTFDPAKLFSYDFIMPVAQADRLYPAMFANLNLVSDYTASIEKRAVPCMVLVRTSSADKIRTKGEPMEFALTDSGAVIKNSSMYKVINSMNGLVDIALPIIDETGYSANVDLYFGNIKSLPQLQNELSRYDLTLVEAQRSLDMLVIRDKEK